MSHYVVIEGTDGSGKTTLSRRIIERLSKGKRPTKLLREPCPETEVGRYIRSRIQDGRSLRNEDIPGVDTLLFTAARVEMFSRLKESRDIWVSDRSFLSTLAYQEIDPNSYFKMMEFFQIPRPDLVLWLNLSEKEAVRRAFERGEQISKERLEVATHRYRKVIESLGSIEARIVSKRDGRRGLTQVLEIDTESNSIEACEQIAIEAIEALLNQE